MAASGPPPVAGSAYVAREGDSWWSRAESVYGDGRLYRALFAWNRTVDPRVSLVPGTSLELPPLQRLQTAWPALMPAP
jgi:nucleoid-associated protein YgaU